MHDELYPPGVDSTSELIKRIHSLQTNIVNLSNTITLVEASMDDKHLKYYILEKKDYNKDLSKTKEKLAKLTKLEVNSREFVELIK